MTNAAPKFHFEYMGGREMTLDEAQAECGELARQAHDLCCWPIQAAKLRREKDALAAEIRNRALSLAA